MSPPAPILARLRAETREAHERLERLVPALEVRTLDAYAALLARHHGFHAPLERRLAAAARRLRGGPTPDGGAAEAGDPVAVAALDALDLPARWKAPLLARDLAELARRRGHSPPDLAALPVCTRLPAVDDLPGLLGTLYVLEGATLGGQLLLRHVGATLGLDAATGAAFHASYGARVGPMWRAFGRALDRAVAAADGRADGGGPAAGRVVAAAGGTFDALADWFADGAAPGGGAPA